MNQIKLIVGLGNPGLEYAKTRHNAGAWYVERLAQRYNVNLREEPKFAGYTARLEISGVDLRLLIPNTYMNLSGKAVASLARFYQIEPQEILVAHDELDLPPGVAKFKQGGGHGGHNGLKDIIAKMGNNNDFLRLRIGIGHPGDKAQVANFVLNRAAMGEQLMIDSAIDESLRATPILFKESITSAMNQLHSFKAEKA